MVRFLICVLLLCGCWFDVDAVDDPTVRHCDDPNNIYLPPTATDTTARLEALRSEMADVEFSAYIIPSEDEHLSEYISARDKKQAWISGFSGSSGTAVVTMDKAAVWTDGRYFLQAEQQLDCNWILMKTGEPGVPSVEEWISKELESDDIAAANPFLFSIESWLYYDEYLAKSNIIFNQSIPDLIDAIWEDRPPREGTEIFIYPSEYAGKEWTDKISDVRTLMTEKNADYLLLTRLEEIAWLFNLRGDELSSVPIFTSYALIARNSNLKLYANTTLLQTAELQEYFQPNDCQGENLCIDTGELDAVRDDLVALPEANIVWMSSESTTYGMYSAIPLERQVQDESPIKLAKSVKNDVEVEGMKQAHIYDAVALCEYLMWLEKNVPNGVIVDEMSGAAKLKSLRLAQAKSKGLSFGSISAVGANAAVIHYGSSPETNKNLTVDEIYLVDSGGQYFEGTTDVTRTMHFGTPTTFEREAFTRVLMGLINIETAIFPATLDGNDLDILARQHLYEVGLDFRHSTGHGIGHYLNIHEYPPGIGREQAEGYPLQPGMFTSNEPGYYKDGKFGIRLENIVVVETTETEYKFGEYDYLTFTAVTLVPFQKNMIDIDLMSNKQLNHLNNYHARVLKDVGNELKNQNKDDVYQWLADVTTPIERNFGLAPSSTFNVFVVSVVMSVHILI